MKVINIIMVNQKQQNVIDNLIKTNGLVAKILKNYCWNKKKEENKKNNGCNYCKPKRVDNFEGIMPLCRIQNNSAKNQQLCRIV